MYSLVAWSCLYVYFMTYCLEYDLAFKIMMTNILSYCLIDKVDTYHILHLSNLWAQLYNIICSED